MPWDLLQRLERVGVFGLDPQCGDTDEADVRCGRVVVTGGHTPELLQL